MSPPTRVRPRHSASPCITFSRHSHSATRERKGPLDIEYRQLGRSELEIPALSFATGTVGGKGEFFGRRGRTEVTVDDRLVDNALARPVQRCLVPVTSFSEYGPGPKGKKPLFWFDVPSRPIFSFAGLWRPTEDGAVFGFLTTEPNSVVAPIYPKATPVILDDQGEARWLAGNLDELVASFPSQLMTGTPT